MGRAIWSIVWERANDSPYCYRKEDKSSPVVGAVGGGGKYLSLPSSRAQP